MKKIVLFYSLFTLVASVSFAQGTDGVIIDPNNSTTRDASAVFQAQSTSQGVLLPRMTAAERALIPVDAAREGLLVYQTSAPAGFYYYDGTQWALVGSTSGSGLSGHVSYWNGTSTQAYDSDANFVWDDANNRLGIGIAVPIAVVDRQKAAPAANEIIFRAGTDADANRFRVDEDGDIFTAASADIGSDVIARGSDVYDNSGPIRLSGEDDVNITMDYNADDNDVSGGRLITFGKNSQSAPTALMQVQESGTVLLNTYTTNGLLKTTGANGTLAIATPGTDYLTGNQTITLTGDVTGSGATSIATTIAANAVTTAKILDNTITNTDVLDGTLLAADLANNAVTNAKLNDMAVNTIKGRVTAGTGDPEDLTAAQAKTILGLTNATTGTGTQYGTTYWATTSTLGSTAVGTNNTVLHGHTGAAPSYSAIVSADITDGTITSADILNGTITSTDILNGTITSTDILNGTISSADILNGTVASADITDNTVSTTDILNGTIATTDMANNAIDGTKIGIGTTHGDLLYYNGTDWARLAAGASGTVLRSNGVAAPSWISLAGSGLGDNLGNHGATTTLDMNSNNITEVNILSTLGSNSYDKLRVWSSSTYSIGMVSAQTMGFIEDYAMTFTMNNDADRGFLWRDADDAASDGAMSLTTDGRLYLKSTAQFNGNVGIGTAAPATKLHIYTGSLGSNTGVTDVIRVELNRSDHSTTPSGPAILFKDQDSNNGTNEARIKMMTVNDVDYGDDDEAASNLVFETTNGGTASDKMIITGRGNVGIGTMNPTYNLQVNGRIRSNAINETSDMRLKTDIVPLSHSLQKVMNMQGVNYKWRTDEFPEMKFDTGLQFGLIAQELEKIIPELVSTDNEGWKSIEYSHLVPVLIEAIKEQQVEIDRLKENDKRIRDMEDSLEKLKAFIQTGETGKTAEK